MTKEDSEFESLIGLEVIETESNGKFKCPDWVDGLYLPRINMKLFDIKDIKKHCLDKQRVRDAIDNRLSLGKPEILIIALKALKKELRLK